MAILFPFKNYNCQCWKIIGCDIQIQRKNNEKIEIFWNITYSKLKCKEKKHHQSLQRLQNLSKNNNDQGNFVARDRERERVKRSIGLLHYCLMWIKCTFFHFFFTLQERRRIPMYMSHYEWNTKSSKVAWETPKWQ